MSSAPILLAVNAGSGTVSVGGWRMTGGGGEPEIPARPEWKAEVTRYTDPQHVVVRCDGATVELDVPGGDPVDPVEAALHELESGPAAAGPLRDVEVVGHRIVHGGSDFTEAVAVDAEVVSSIEGATVWAPLHNEAGLALLRWARDRLPRAKHVAVFDTAFCSRMPDGAALYGGPSEWVDDGIRRYGFHGISHADALERTAAHLGVRPQDCQIISVHLGGGCSATASRDGRGVATTMGTTPNDGMVMATRSGSVDPGVVTYLQARDSLSAQDVDQMLNRGSGLLGLTGGATGDIAEAHAMAERGDADASRAVEVYLNALCREVAGLRPALDRLDALVLTGGAVEGERWLQTEISRRLSFLGLEIAPGAEGAKVPVIELEAQEERSIAETAWGLNSKPRPDVGNG